ncbi:MAG TPA: 16S rRNA (adenine(1518)-N(6)/adenine(1519)-N(6))-dimethyltransferase RsmA [Actinomycetota bacterium]|nr:16S rRNA (adenine(1518)-N(6)/adenine(1519)-N(6))-dimethyltransferase RsmA [Actinomycetota bacterium]
MEIAERHGIRPRKSLGQHFLADVNLAEAIAREAGAAPGTRFLEIGPGLGSLTVALADAGAEVLAVEIDRRVADALGESIGSRPGVSVVVADALRVDWPSVLDDGAWRMASNLPYNVAVPVVMELLEQAPGVDPMLVMVQREVGERLAAAPGTASYGAVSVRVSYHASVRLVRRVGTKVFWPEPNVESVVVRLDRREPPVRGARERVMRLVDEGFAQRRKTLASALVRLGMDRVAARAALEGAGIEASSRAEQLSIEDFGRLAEAVDG